MPNEKLFAQARDELFSHINRCGVLNATDEDKTTWMDETIEIKIRNHKEEPVKVIVKENLYRWTNWRITESTHHFKKIDSRTIHFPVEVPKDGEATVRYTVHYSW